MKTNMIQSFPTADSPNYDAFEGIVELYYQIKGYITSSGKWFWKFDKLGKKQQRGYQDIDVLAINEKETIIVSVTSNLDDKINFSSNGSKRSLNLKKLEKSLTYFHRVIEYFKATTKYNWIVDSRSVKKVFAVVNSGSDKYFERLKQSLLNESISIEILTIKDILDELKKYLESEELKNTTIQNQLLRLLQLMNRQEYF